VIEFSHRPLYRWTEIEMLGQLDMVRHQEVGLGLLLVVALVLTVTAIAPGAAHDIAFVPLMTAHGIGVGLVVLFADSMGDAPGLQL
jgi:hypothetical protein